MKDPDTDPRPRTWGIWLALKAYAKSDKAGMSAVISIRGYFPPQQIQAMDFAAQAIEQGRTFADEDDWRAMTLDEIKEWEREDRQMQADVERDRLEREDDDE